MGAKWNADQIKALEVLKNHRGELSAFEYHNLRGQIAAGEPAAAMKGLRTILIRKRNAKGATT